ncbi:Uncharacterised protein [Shigella flexneri]|nr:Uncharacterised protein [Shigella flexneri]
MSLAAAVDHHRNVGINCLLVAIGIPQFNNQIAAAAIDDVLTLTPVKMHWRDLRIAHMHDLLGVTFHIRHSFC